MTTARFTNKIRLLNNSPPITAPFHPILIESLQNINLEDRALFDYSEINQKGNDKNIASKYFILESQYVSQLNSLLLEGRSVVETLYAFRSCGKAIPQVQSQDQSNKEELYLKTCEILSPEINRMTELMSFCSRLISGFFEALTAIIPHIKDKDVFPSETFLLTLANILDLAICLDTMKNFKGSMSNDLSMYKRAKSMLVKDHLDAEFNSLPKLAMFLANKDFCVNEVKRSLSTISNLYEDIFIDLMNLCAEYLEKGHYIFPNSKHTLLRAIAFTIVLLDGDNDEADILKRRKIKTDKIQKILKANLITPVFGDIAIPMSSILIRAPHWPTAKFDLNQMDKESKEAIKYGYMLSNKIPTVDGLFHNTIAKLHTCRTLINSTDELSQNQVKLVYDTSFESLKLLSNLSIDVLEQTAWKYLNPIDTTSEAQRYSIYEKAVQYNYDANDKRSLIQYLYMIKSLARILFQIEQQVQPLFDILIGNEIQMFVKGTITDYYNNAIKKKKASVTLLKNLRDCLLDVNMGEKVNPNNPSKRTDPISGTQLLFARSMLDLCFNEKSKGMKGGLMKEKSFKDNQVTELQQFFNNSYFFSFMIDFKNSISQSSDLSNLWFKEFYLELSREIQFPISTSLPWILADFALETHDTRVLQNIFLPLDLYNDAAFKTLHHLKSQYIYLEIEAEVNLCFDQFMFKLGRKVFTHYKKLAALQLLNPETKYQVNQENSIGGLAANAFDSILSQKQFRLLGRSIDISSVLTQMMNQYIKHSIDVAISRFESSDIPSIIELETLLEICRLTHFLLLSRLDLESFDDMLMEIDGCISPGQNNGRILAHIIDELVNDFTPNYCFNNSISRFVKGSVFYTEPIERTDMGNFKAMYLYGSKTLGYQFESKLGSLKDFIGSNHFMSIYRLVKAQGLNIIVSEIEIHIKLIMENSLDEVIELVDDLCPFSIHIPIEPENLTEMFDYFAQRYSPLTQHNNFKSDILQSFRELGNSLMVVFFLQDALNYSNCTNRLLIQDIISEDSTTASYINQLCSAGNSSKALSSGFPISQWTQTTADIFQTLNKKTTFVERILNTMHTALKRMNSFTENGSITGGKSFAKALNAIQFSASVPAAAGSRNIREIFGDSLSVSFSAVLQISEQASIYQVINLNEILLTLFDDEVELNSNVSISDRKMTVSLRSEVKQFIKNSEWMIKGNQEWCTVFSAFLIKP
ncbi:cytoplasmic fragile-X interacting family-domain-containing protein [Globomyces pollinis-pini]|nr:cytoplasmic fragile-X interacting family-domain-containing protein [Globomyces pollinis-pini]